MRLSSPSLPRDRRALPGSRGFVSSRGPATVICGTRKGAAKHRRLAPVSQHYLLAPLDLDPGSVSWPVKDSPGVTVQRQGAPAEFTLRLVQALLADGAMSVVVLQDPEPASFHKREATIQ